MFRKPSPWAVLCPRHGLVHLTREEYDAQMSNPDGAWRCPIGHELASWDDATYDAWCDEHRQVENGGAL